MPNLMFRVLLFLTFSALTLTGCSSRQVQESLTGSTAQRLVSHSIDQLMDGLPAEDFEPLRGSSLWVESSFIEEGPIKRYADQRLKFELTERFGITLTSTKSDSEARMVVFYTSLATDQELAGFFLPLGAVPGLGDQSRVNLITLEKFHGVAELYYFIESDRGIERGPTLISRTRTDALGLPVITIPISRLPEGEAVD